LSVRWPPSQRSQPGVTKKENQALSLHVYLLPNVSHKTIQPTLENINKKEFFHASGSQSEECIADGSRSSYSINAIQRYSIFRPINVIRQYISTDQRYSTIYFDRSTLFDNMTAIWQYIKQLVPLVYHSINDKPFLHNFRLHLCLNNFEEFCLPTLLLRIKKLSG